MKERVIEKSTNNYSSVPQLGTSDNIIIINWIHSYSCKKKISNSTRPSPTKMKNGNENENEKTKCSPSRHTNPTPFSQRQQNKRQGSSRQLTLRPKALERAENLLSESLPVDCDPASSEWRPTLGSTLRPLRILSMPPIWFGVVGLVGSVNGARSSMV